MRRGRSAVYAVALIGGITVAFDNPARRSFVVEMVAEDEVANAVSLNSALMTGSRIVGPALAGLLVSTVGYGWAFLVDGLSYMAVIAGARGDAHRRTAPAPVTPRGRGPGARRGSATSAASPSCGCRS